MLNKSQVSIFIVLGLIVLLSLSLFFYVRGEVTEIIGTANIVNSFSQMSDMQYLKPYIEGCLYEKSNIGLKQYTGLQGGYIDTEYNKEYGMYKDVNFTVFDGKKVAYYWNNSVHLYPNVTEMEEYLARYIIVEFEECLNFSRFKNIVNVTKPAINYTNITFNFSAVPVDIRTSINWEDVTVHISYPIIIYTVRNSLKLNDFIINIPVRLGLMYNTSLMVVNDFETCLDPFIISDHCDSYNTSENRINITYKQSDGIIIIINETDPLYEEYKFQFAIYNGSKRVSGSC